MTDRLLVVLFFHKAKGCVCVWGWRENSRGDHIKYFFPFYCHALKKEMAAHSSVLAWRIPGMGEPGGLPSMESHRVGHD